MRRSLLPLLRARARFNADMRGASAVEFAIIAPVFFFLLFGVIECGQMLWMQNSLQYAVEQAARCAVVNSTTCGSTSATQAYAASMVYGRTVSSAVFSVASASCGTEVSASYPFTAVLIPISVTLTASSCRPS